MKRIGQLMESIAAPDNLRLAFWKAARSKRGKPDCRRFQEQLDENLEEMRQELLSGQMPVGDYHYFTIHDPKRRLICAASFRERVLHHALMNVCEPVLERAAVYDSYACRKGKGRLLAVERAQRYARQHGWFLKLDIRKYFDSIHHDTLRALLQRKFKDPVLLSLFDRILSSYETAPGCGLPIGNLTSQHFANYYLAPLDRFIKEDLQRTAYVRYMDDFVMWGPSAKELREVCGRIRAFLATALKLDLKDNTAINQTAFGMDFLGYRLFPDTVRLARRSKLRFARKFRGYERAYERGLWPELTLQQRMQALLAFVLPVESGAFRRHVLKRFGVVAIGLEPGNPRWQLEQQCDQLPVSEPQQQQPGEPEQQQRIPVRPAPSSTRTSHGVGADPAAILSCRRAGRAGKHTACPSGASSPAVVPGRKLPAGQFSGDPRTRFSMNSTYRLACLEKLLHVIAVVGLVLGLSLGPVAHAATSSSDSTLTVVDTRKAGLPGALSGTIKSAAGALVPNATVVLASFSNRTNSDTQGRFLLTNVPPGIGYVATISAAGYLATNISQIGILTGKTNNLGNIILKTAPGGPLSLSPLSPDVNPVESESRVEEGGVALRYYQLRRGLQPAGSVTVTIRRTTGEVLTGLSGGPTDSPGLQEPISDATGLVRIAIPASVAGRGPQRYEVVANGVVLASFPLKVVSRRFDQVWKEGVGVGVTGKSGIFRLSTDGSVQTTVTQPTLLLPGKPGPFGDAEIESEWAAELKVGIEVGFGMRLGPVRTGVRVGSGLKGGFSGGETFAVAGVDDLDPTKSALQLFASVRRIVSPLVASVNSGTSGDLSGNTRIAAAWLSEVVSKNEAALQRDSIESRGEVELGGYGLVDLELQGRIFKTAGLGLNVNLSVEASGYRQWSENLSLLPGTSESRLGTRQQLQAEASLLGSGDFHFQHLDKSLELTGAIGVSVDQSVGVAIQGATTLLRTSRAISATLGGGVGTSGWKIPDLSEGSEAETTITEDLEVSATSQDVLQRLTAGENGWKLGPDQAIANLFGPQEPLRMATSLVTAAGREGVPIKYERQWEKTAKRTPVDLDFDLNAAIAGIGLKLNAEYSQGARAIYERGIIVGQRLFATEFYPKDSNAMMPTESLLVKQARWARASSSVINVAATIFEDPVAAVKRTLDVRNIRDGAQIVAGSIQTAVADSIRGWSSPMPPPLVPGPRRSAMPAGVWDAYVPGVNSSNWIYGVMGLVHLQGSRTFQGTATLHFYYGDDAVIGLIPTDLRVYRERLTNGIASWGLLGGTVNPASNSVAVTTDRLGTFCLAPPMPAGQIDLIGQTNLLAADGQTLMEVLATNLVLNTGESVPNRPPFEGGYLYTVQTDGVELLGLDVQPAIPGFQIAATNGVLRFSIRSPRGGTEARVRVRSVVGDAEGILSIALRDQSAPEAPVEVIASSVSGSRIQVLWKTNSEPDLAGYRVYYVAGATAPSATDRAAWNGTAAIEGQPSPVWVGTAGTLLRGLNAEADYFVGLVAVDLAGNESSMTVAGPVHTRAGNPAPPTDAVVRFNPAGFALLSWSLSADDGVGDRSVSRYEVWRQILPGGAWQLASQVATGLGSFEESPPAAAADHFFRYALKAVDQSGRVSLSVIAIRLLSSGIGIDMDGDGMPDWWEAQNGLNDLDPADGRGDDDGDGVSNLAEYIAGTDPLNSDSRLFLRANFAEGILWLSWPSVAGKSYRLERSPNLEGPWELVADGQSAEPPANYFPMDVGADPQAYFRIVVE